MAINTKKYIERFLKIKTKDSKIVNFKLNEPQEKLYNVIKKLYEEKKPIRIIILKARQMGFSTLTEGIIFKKTATNSNVTSGIVAHTEDATSNLFNMSKLFYTELPDKLKPERLKSNSKELIFDSKNSHGLKSKIKCMTAGGDGIGRSDTFQNLHISEYAFWKGDKKNILVGLLQAVSDTPDSMVIIESTANGFDDFKKRWDDAVAKRSDYTAVFFAWYELKSYRKDGKDLVLTKEEEILKKLYNLDNDQLAWRRWKIANDCNGDPNIFRQEFPSSPEEAFVGSGHTVFDKTMVISQIEAVRNLKPLKRGYFEYEKEIVSVSEYKISNIKWIEDDNGYITIHKEPSKILDSKTGAIRKLHPYVIGADVAGSGEDYFTAKVVDSITADTHATMRVQYIDEDLFADQLYCLGFYYHEALIGVEVNYSIVADRELGRLKYPNIYQREVYNFQDKRYIKQTGFITNSVTRPLMISKLVKLFREDITHECDIETLKECLTFIKNEKGRAEARSGYHDDLIMARAICELLREQQDLNYIDVNLDESFLPFALQTENDKEEEENMSEYFEDWFF